MRKHVQRFEKRKPGGLGFEFFRLGRRGEGVRGVKCGGTWLCGVHLCHEHNHGAV